MTTRRKFIKTVTLGTVAMSASGTMQAFSPAGRGQHTSNNDPAPWDCSFDEDKSKLHISSTSAEIDATLSFVSDGKAWSLCASRDGVRDRFSLVAPDGNVQGYWTVNSDGGRLEILFFHRSAQNYEGVFSLDGKVRFRKGSFACRTHAGGEERVLNLTSGVVDNRHNDSIFSPEDDILLSFCAASLGISSEADGVFGLRMSGRIHKSSESTFRLTLTRNWFRDRYMPYYKAISAKPGHKIPTGWMSWNTYFDKATAEDNLAEARIGKKYLQPFGCDIWHIESWQGNSDKLPVSKFYNMNLEVNEKQFPKGMKRLADDIRKLGFIPGLWTAPFGTGSEEFYNEHKDWFLHDSEGRPISCWNGRFTLDPTVPEAREHIKEIHRIASREWGYGYFKVDGMSGRNQGYCAHLYERPEIRACFHDPSCPNPFELCLKAIREGIGEDRYLLACQGHSTGPESTYADASRLGADIVHPDMPVVWPNVMNQARCFLNQAFAHNITMICDPDTLLVKDLSVEEARVSATIIALPGQLTFFGDKLAGLDDGRMKILQQTLPPARVRPVSLYPYFDMIPVWNLGVDNGKMQSYNVVALFNWSDSEAEISADARELGIEAVPMDTYEFWTGMTGRIDDGVLKAAVPARGVRVFALHRRQDRPQWLGSDRHISMNACEISGYGWDGKVLSMDIDLVGGFPMTEHFSIPEGFRLSDVRCTGATCTQSLKDGSLALVLESKKTLRTHLELVF